MARIAGVNIPNHKHAEIALTAIFGVGRTRAQKICVAAGVVRSCKIMDLTDPTSKMSGSNSPDKGLARYLDPDKDAVAYAAMPTLGTCNGWTCRAPPTS